MLLNLSFKSFFLFIKDCIIITNTVNNRNKQRESFTFWITWESNLNKFWTGEYKNKRTDGWLTHTVFIVGWTDETEAFLWQATLSDTNIFQQFLGTGFCTLQVRLSQTKAKTLMTYLRMNTQQITSRSFTYRQHTDEKIQYISLQYAVYYGLLWIFPTSYH